MTQEREHLWSKTKDGGSGQEAGKLISEYFIEKKVMPGVKLCQDIYLLL